MKTRFVRAAASIIIVMSWFRLPAQETAAQRHEMATNQLKGIAADISSQCLTDIRTPEYWKKQRPELRRQLLEMLGLDPLPARTALKAEITGRLEHNDYRIEKIVFQSRPGLYVTGNFYVPNRSAGPLPTILYLCGHSPHPLGAKVEYQDRAIWFAAHGYLCLVLDTLEFGEVAGIHHGTHDLNMWHWLSLGYTPAGTEVWNAMRALDYLETRPEVDPKRFGVTGRSGGGAQSWFLAAADDRPQCIIPVAGIVDLQAQVCEGYPGRLQKGAIAGHCDCMFMVNSYRWDFPLV